MYDVTRPKAARIEERRLSSARLSFKNFFPHGSIYSWYLVTSQPHHLANEIATRIELSLALFWTFMNRNLLTFTLFSYFKEMTGDCETFLPVFNLSNVTVYIHRTL